MEGGFRFRSKSYEPFLHVIQFNRFETSVDVLVGGVLSDFDIGILGSQV